MDDDLPWRRRANATLDPTYARPEPWFVGSGTGLMILILSILAILLVARGVTTLWLIEDAWAWWQHRATPSAVRREPPPAPPRFVLPPPASYAEEDWITPNDYPAAALRANQQGRVRIRWSVRPDGRVSDCRVVESSGHRLLDDAACSAIRRNGRYPPVAPAAPPRVRTRAVVWQIPTS